MSKHPVRDGIGLSIGVLIYDKPMAQHPNVDNIAPKK